MAALRHVLAAQRAALGAWPVHHLPGNHDLDPSLGGLAAWREVMGNASAPPVHAAGNYRSLRRAGWRLLLLDTQDGVRHDTGTPRHIPPTALLCEAARV